MKQLATVALCGIVLASCASPLPDLPSDPRDRCEAMGGYAYETPPIVEIDGTIRPSEFDSCHIDVHQSEEMQRAARRAWHEKHKSDDQRERAPA